MLKGDVSDKCPDDLAVIDDEWQHLSYQLKWKLLRLYGRAYKYDLKTILICIEISWYEEKLS